MHIIFFFAGMSGVAHYTILTLLFNLTETLRKNSRLMICFQFHVRKISRTADLQRVADRNNVAIESPAPMM